jgi:Acetyltransferase (GNAT) domain
MKLSKPVPAPPALQVTDIDPWSDSRWLTFLTESEAALVYHHPAWLRVLKDAFGHEIVALACADSDGNLQGVLPLVRTKGKVAGDALSSLPHTPVAGPLARSNEATRALLQAAVKRVAAERRLTLQIRASGPGLDGLVDGLVGIPWVESYGRELPPTDEELRFRDARNHSTVKRAVKKAQKSGVEVTLAQSDDELRAWYRLYLETMRSHGVPPLPFRFFASAWNVLRPLGLMRLVLASLPGRGLIAGSVFFLYGNGVWFAFNGRRKDDLALRPNDAIQWRAIHDAHADGFRRFEMGEVESDNPGLATFKVKWGMEPKFLYRYYFPVAPARRVFAAGTLAHRFVRAPWRWLPLGLTAFLGERLYR